MSSVCEMLHCQYNHWELESCEGNIRLFAALVSVRSSWAPTDLPPHLVVMLWLNERRLLPMGMGVGYIGFNLSAISTRVPQLSGHNVRP